MCFTPREKHFRSVLWRCLVGPAAILDGLIGTLTFGNVMGEFTLRVTRRLALSRILNQ